MGNSNSLFSQDKITSSNFKHYVHCKNTFDPNHLLANKVSEHYKNKIQTLKNELDHSLIKNKEIWDRYNILMKEFDRLTERSEYLKNNNLSISKKLKRKNIEFCEISKYIKYLNNELDIQKCEKIKYKQMIEEHLPEYLDKMWMSSSINEDYTYNSSEYEDEDE